MLCQSRFSKKQIITKYLKLLHKFKVGKLLNFCVLVILIHVIPRSIHNSHAQAGLGFCGVVSKQSLSLTN